jgi:hypothetical protein
LFCFQLEHIDLDQSEDFSVDWQSKRAQLLPPQQLQAQGQGGFDGEDLCLRKTCSMLWQSGKLGF